MVPEMDAIHARRERRDSLAVSRWPRSICPGPTLCLPPESVDGRCARPGTGRVSVADSGQCYSTSDGQGTAGRCLDISGPRAGNTTLLDAGAYRVGGHRRFRRTTRTGRRRVEPFHTPDRGTRAAVFGAPHRGGRVRRRLSRPRRRGFRLRRLSRSSAPSGRHSPDTGVHSLVSRPVLPPIPQAARAQFRARKHRLRHPSPLNSRRHPLELSSEVISMLVAICSTAC